MKTLRKNYKYIIAGIALLTFVLILEDVFEVPMLSMDKYMYALLVIELRNNTLTAIMKMITFMGSAYFLGAFIIISFIFIKNKDRKSTRLNSSHQIISYAVFCL